MLEIHLRFPAGRYHATPWDHHVNEGIVEWPPSPWRLLRALVATWHLKDGADEGVLRRLVERLAGSLPIYRLPPTQGSHTRHYMPLAGEKTAKVFDTFLHLGEGAVAARWPEVELEADERALLARLLEKLGYLGRAESWATGELVTPGPSGRFDVRPLTAERAEPGVDVVPVLAPLPPAAYLAWRGEEVARRASGKKKPGARERQLLATLPETLFEALGNDTADLRKAGWSQPPGSRWVDYQRPAPAAEPAPPRARRRAPAPKRTVARFALAGPVLPRLTEAFTVADRVRRALMSQAGGSAVFSGHDQDDAKLLGHRHAFVLPESNGRFGHVSHVTIYAAMGFDDDALRALDRLRVLYDPDAEPRRPQQGSEASPEHARRHDLQLVLLGVGQPESFAGTDVRAGRSPLLASSCEWVSRTPFIPTRHPKATRAGVAKLDASGLQIGSPEHDLRRLLTELGATRGEAWAPLEAVPTAGTWLGGKAVSWSAFRTHGRRGEGRRASAIGHGFRLRFAEPVRGPIAVGFGAHFGLGSFTPAGVFEPVVRGTPGGER